LETDKLYGRVLGGGGKGVGKGYKVLYRNICYKFGHREMRSKIALNVQYDGVGEGGLKINERQKVVLRRPFFSCSSLSRSTEIARSGSETAEATAFRNTFTGT
jgi:hypothetical protein